MVQRQGQTPDLPGVTKRLAEKENIKLHTEQRSITEFSNWSPFPKTLGEGDLALFMILIVVFISNINGIQSGGPGAFIYWLIGLVTFLLPCAFVTQWLARRYPGEGAPHLWVKRIAGPNWSFISAFCIWLPGVFALISVIDHGLVLSRYLLPGLFVTPLQQGISGHPAAVAPGTFTTLHNWLPSPGNFSLSFMFGWLGSVVPRMQTLFGKQRRINTSEKELRDELVDSYKEQQLLVEQQQILLAEVGRLYHEQSQAAVTDTITGLPNHRAIMCRLGEEIAICQETQGTCAVLFVDLDQFKLINDTWGHRAGDAILHEIGARLRSSLRQEDFVGRYGGEEFAIVLPNTDIIAARYKAERLRQAIVNKPCKWFIEDSQVIIPITVTASIGIAIYGLHGLTREELVDYADRGMYQAKHAGRNCVCIADVAADTGMEKRSAQAQKSKEETIRDKVKVPGELVIPEQTVQALIAVVSAHDPGIYNHAHRMMKLAKITARKLQVPRRELPLLYLTALFHDIGKVGIPDAILHKPGPLSDEEWLIMRQHPEIGRQILVQTGGIFQQVATCVAAHHERWDGDGYPNRLAGEAIPLCARIISVIDAYETMTARRTYQEPRTIEEAQAEIERCAGRQFDPQVVKAFLSVLEEREQKKREDTSTGSLIPSDLKTIEGEDAPHEEKSTLANDLTPYAKSRKR